ncbi:MAG: hypothetical protein ACT4N4_03230 [Rhodospirillales bacterium]
MNGIRSSPTVQRVPPRQGKAGAASLAFMAMAAAALLVLSVAGYLARATVLHALCSVELLMRLALMMHGDFESFCGGR